jgi:hypothetical protein
VEPPLQWDCRVPVLTNRFMVWDFAKVIVIAVIVIEAVGALMTFIIDGEVFFLPPLVFGIPLAVLVVLYVLVTGLILGNRYDMSFSLNVKGVSIGMAPSRAGSWAIKTLGVLANLIGGRFLGAFASATGEVGEQIGVQWSDVVQVRVYPRERVISLCDSWHTIQRLYCPPDIFDEVAARVRTYTAKAISRWEAQKAARPRPPWGFYAVWALLAVGATLASGAWYWAEPLRDRIALLAGLLVLLSGLLSGVFAWLCGMAGIITSLITLGTLLLPAMERKTYAGLGASYGFEIDTGLLLLSLLGTIVLLGMSTFRVLDRGPGSVAASRRGRK